MDDVIVIGGGPGGLNVALAASAVGARVTLVEKFRLGGGSTFSASVPSKALLESAKVAHQVRRAGLFGVKVGVPEVDFEAVMGRVGRVVEGVAGRVSVGVLEEQGIRVVLGDPEFEAYDTLVVEGQRLNARKFVIATGSRPRIPEIPGLEESGYLDNVSFWGLRKRPESLVVVGGGAEGVELGQAMGRLGVKVTILEAGPRLLGGEDEEMGERLREGLEGEGVSIFTGVDVTGVSVQEGRKRVRFRTGRESRDVEGAEILVVMGRLANVEGLNLKAVGVRTDPVHGIEVDEHLRTYAPNIWAVGDVNGLDLSVHAAERQASVVFQNAVLGLGARYERRTVPRVCFTEPEVASVGLSEAEARGVDPSVRVFRVDLEENDRARIASETGMVKVVASEKGKVLGASVCGPGASLVVHELVLAMEKGLSLNDLGKVAHLYPTLAGAVRKVANRFAATRLEKPVVRTALRWIYGYEPEEPDVISPPGSDVTSAWPVLDRRAARPAERDG